MPVVYVLFPMTIISKMYVRVSHVWTQAAPFMHHILDYKWQHTCILYEELYSNVCTTLGGAYSVICHFLLWHVAKDLNES